PVLASWPGPYTWLWPVKDEVSELVCGQHPTLAVRVSAHPVVQELCQAYGKAIISTSANPAGVDPARNADEVKSYFQDQLDYIIDAPVGASAQPTEIRDVMSNKVIRPA
ncbi:MAG: Sua5/YciO/YrdC/YwlC family protein, partial [Gammaproteobacteria bacterium]|nr:Sua5/YciO/YrdC/YwlC family protein [Gammaproteobacteria bacterium]